MGGSNKTKSKQTQTSMPPTWATPLFEQSSNDALNLYNSGKGGNVYQGQRVGDLSGNTVNAINGLQNAVGNYNNSHLQSLFNNPTASNRNLSNMASGQMVGNNTKFNEALQNTLNNTATTINSQMSGAGRYGSGAHTGVMANQLGQTATNAMAQQYNQDVQNMLNANQLIDNSNINQLGAANSYFQGQNNALLNALQGSSILDQNNQNKINANREKWLEEDNRDWNRLAQFIQAAQGSAGNYGVTKTKGTQKQGSNPLNAVGNLFGPMMMSDLRAKENIEYTGKRNGYNVYDFNYIGKPERYRGVIAQEVIQTCPEAVIFDHNNGLMMVDYGKIGFPMERIA